MRKRGWLAALVGGAVVGLVGGARGRLTRYEIAENSMAPALQAGDYVFAVRAGPILRRGDVVIFPHPEEPGMELVKRVAAGPGDRVEQPGQSLRLGPDEVYVLGDNTAASTADSRELGPIALASVAWRVSYRYWPPSRLGKV